MKREFVISLVLSILANALVKPFYILGIDRTIQNRTGPQSYGLYFALLSFTLLFQVINDFGIHLYQSRNIAQHPHLLHKLLPSTLALKGVLAICFSVLVCGAAWLAGYQAEAWQLLGWLIGIQILTSLMLFLRSSLTGLGYYRLDSLLSVADRLLLIIVLGCILWVFPYGKSFQVLWLAQAQLVTLSIAVLLAAIALWHHLRHQPQRLHWRPRLPLMRIILRQSAPFALAIFLMTAYTRLDAVMLERLLPNGTYEAGVYASAYRLLDAANMVGALFAGLLLPMFARLLKAQIPTRPLTDLAFRLIMTLALTTAVSCTTFRHQLMNLLYTHAQPEWEYVLSWLIWSFVATSSMYIFGTLLTAGGYLKILNHLFATSIALNIALNLWLIPHWGAIGAAIATVFTQAFVSLRQMHLAQRLQHSGPTRSTILRLGIFVLLLAGTAVASTVLHIAWPARLAIVVACGPLWAWSLKLIPLQQLAKWMPYPANKPTNK